MDLIAEFRFKYKENRYLLTSRPHGITEKVIRCFGNHLHDINYLDHQKVADFIRKWFRVVSGQAFRMGAVKAEDMLSDVMNQKHIATFTQTPLLLAAVCILYLAGKRIPEQRADLYNRILENLLWRRFHDPAHPELENHVALYLMSLAFRMQVKNRKTIEEGEAKQVLKEISPKFETESNETYLLRINRLFQEIEPNCGLLNRRSNGEIEFSHLTFQEFLTAKYMVNMDQDFLEYLNEEWWEETLILHSGYINLNMKKRSNKMVEMILTTKTENAKYRNRLRLLAQISTKNYKRPA